MNVIWPGSAGQIVAFSRGKFSGGEGTAVRTIIKFKFESMKLVGKWSDSGGSGLF